MEKEFYNAPRVIAVFEDMWSGEQHEQEINFYTRPFSSQEKADEYTEKEILSWISERGNDKYNTDLDLVSWKRYI